jgi:hypothetical protein
MGKALWWAFVMEAYIACIGAESGQLDCMESIPMISIQALSAICLFDGDDVQCPWLIVRVRTIAARLHCVIRPVDQVL